MRPLQATATTNPPPGSQSAPNTGPVTGLRSCGGSCRWVARPGGVDGGCANDGGEDQVERGRELLAEGQLTGLVEYPPVKDSEVGVEQDEGGTIWIDAEGDVAGSVSRGTLSATSRCASDSSARAGLQPLPGADHRTSGRGVFFVEVGEHLKAGRIRLVESTACCSCSARAFTNPARSRRTTRTRCLPSGRSS